MFRIVGHGGIDLDTAPDTTLRIGVMPGDGIGPEIVPEAVAVMSAAVEAESAPALVFDDVPVGWSAYLEHGNTLPPGTIERLAGFDGLILGPINHAAYPSSPDCPNPHPIIRKRLDLFANLRPARTFSGARSLHDGVDLVVVRENNEDFQPDRNMIAGCGEFQATEESAYSIRVITRRQSERIARTAFDLAGHRRRRVTVIHKKTVFKITDGLFFDSVVRVANDHPDVELTDEHVDTAAMRLVMTPENFDVVLCPNLYGDIISDLAAGLVGGLGMAPGLSAGDDIAMAQATHGSAPDLAGQDLANPCAMVLSGRLLLEWLAAKHADDRLRRAAGRIERAVADVLEEGKWVTPDLGGDATTSEMGNAIVRGCRSVADG